MEDNYGTVEPENFPTEMRRFQSKTFSINKKDYPDEQFNSNETQERSALLLLVVTMMTIGSNQRYTGAVSKSALIVAPVQW
ncbi:hypothetical protein HZH66_008814 [Vespula vulgaris]|uniref:Uncharacterized protein n=1 Tax=Vespula vulgaris TaxID=7454 RepID=A0A834JSW1_VESVU|nr:hypothetical protein HZH66_008814 [Vespula vulgaris]